jgi:hypothetical protein
MFGVLIRSRGMPVGCDSIEPTTNPIRRLFTAISTSPRAATAVEISFTICCAGVTIRRSNQLNYAPKIKRSSDSVRFPPAPSRTFPFPLPCRDRAACNDVCFSPKLIPWSDGGSFVHLPLFESLAPHQEIMASDRGDEGLICKSVYCS